MYLATNLEETLNSDKVYVEFYRDGVYIYGHKQELVSWVSDEWIEDPAVVHIVVNAILFGIKYGASALARTVWSSNRWAETFGPQDDLVEANDEDDSEEN
jgi:hypothetical protein